MDARLLEAKDLLMNEAALTGESPPVEKHVYPAGLDTGGLTGASSAVFRGTRR